jgi:hypothetical protein
MKRGRVVCIVFFPLLLGAAVPADAQRADIAVGVIPFLGDDEALRDRAQRASIREAGNQEGFTPRLLATAIPVRADEPPESWLLEEMPYALTGEYYFDDEDMQHMQLWLWESGNGALVYTDELVAEDADEAEGYLPALVKWMFSHIPMPEEPDVEPEPEAEVEESEEEEEPRVFYSLREEPEAAAYHRPEWLYLGLRAALALDFQTIRPFGEYEGGTGQSIGGEAALTVEVRPWRNIGFLAEGVFVMDSFAPSRRSGDVYTADRYTGMSLMFPFAVKVSLDTETFRLGLLAGAYYNLPLRRTSDSGSYGETMKPPPLGIMAGIEAGYVLGPGELYGGLRFGNDLGLTAVEEIGLYYTRLRALFSLGYAFKVF